MNEDILKAGVLAIKIEHIDQVSEEEYAMLRKESFGGSDSSILCGVNLYKNMEQLIHEKNCKFITDEEKEVGEKAIVRKGKDLEPIILDKASKELGLEILKPTSMFVFKEEPVLTLNYDGVTKDKDNRLIPVEAKLVSKWGEKYYNKDKTIEENKELDMKVEGDSLEAHIKRKATKIGIPAYYYTQVQQEMMGLNAPYGYLAVLFDETWTFKLYLVKADNFVQNKIFDLASKHKKELS